MTFHEVKFGEEIGSSGEIDGELLPIRCVCGYGNYWEFPISIYSDDPTACPECGRKYYFRASFTVFCEEAGEGAPGKTREEKFKESRDAMEVAVERIDALRKKNDQ